MASSSPDLSSVPMAGESSAGASMLRSPMDVSHQSGPTEEDNSIMSALPKESTIRKKRNTRAEGYNMRKSIAWNQAFFTEEGVLDPIELSLLGSSTKSNRDPKSVSKMSPLSLHSKSNIRPPLHDLGGNIHGVVYTNSQKKVPRGKKLFPSIIESEAHVISGRTPSVKAIPRSISPSPTTYSQKRVANVSTTSPASKLPKIMPTKTHTSSVPLTSSSAMLARGSSKPPRVNVRQDGGVKAVGTAKHSGFPSSSKFSAAGHRRSTTSLVKDSSINPKTIPRHLSSANLNESLASNTMKAATSTYQGFSNVSRDPAPVHARPSALRMPTPSASFFCQAKALPSDSNHSRRPLEQQPFESKLPSFGKPMHLRRECELGISTSTGHKAAKNATAVNSSAGDGSSMAFKTAASEAYSSIQKRMEVKLASGKQKSFEVKQADGKYKRVPMILESSHDKKDCLALSNDHLLKYNHDNHTKSVISGPGELREVDDEVRSSEVGNNLFSEGTSQPVQMNIPAHVEDTCPSTSVLLESEPFCPNPSSEIHFLREHIEHGSEIQVDSGTNTLITESNASNEFSETCTTEGKHSVGNSVDNLSAESHTFLQNGTYTDTTEKQQSARNSDVCDQGYGCTTGNIVCDPHSEAFNSAIQMPSACPSRTIQLSSPSAVSTSKHSEAAIARGNAVTNFPNSELLKDLKPICLQDSEPAHEPSQNISSTKDTSSPQGENTSNDKTKQRLPVDAVPFSDEWLAAVEAFGEDILVQKTGAVQNSPPNKAPPAPGPWSPVKRKAQDIGPYDCTKYLKNNPSADS